MTNSVVYNCFFLNMSLKLVDFDSDTLKIALITDSYTEDKAHTFWDTDSGPGQYEVTSTLGYSAGGATLTSVTCVQDDTNDLVKLDAANQTWQTSTISAKGAVIYDASVSSSLIAAFAFTETKSSANGNFTIQFSDSGLMELKQGT